MERIKCAAFNKKIQDGIPKEIREKMKADRNKTEREMKNELKAKEKLKTVEVGTKTHVGIDPGTQTGIAVWDKNKKKFNLIKTLKIHEAMDLVLKLKSKAEVKIYCENPFTWVSWTDEASSDVRKQGAGSIKRDYSIWKDFAKDYDIEFVGTRLQKNLKKIKHLPFTKLTKWNKQTTQHSRDAALLVFGI